MLAWPLLLTQRGTEFFNFLLCKKKFTQRGHGQFGQGVNTPLGHSRPSLGKAPKIVKRDNIDEIVRFIPASPQIISQSESQLMGVNHGGISETDEPN